MADDQTNRRDDRRRSDQIQAAKQHIASPANNQKEKNQDSQSWLNTLGDVVTEAERAITAFSYGIAEGMTTIPVSHLIGFKPDDKLEATLLGIGNFIGFAPKMFLAGSGNISKSMAEILQSHTKAAREGKLHKIEGAVGKASSKLSPETRKVIQKYSNGHSQWEKPIAQTLNRFGGTAQRMSRIRGLTSLPEFVGGKADELMGKYFRMDNYGRRLRVGSQKASDYIFKSTGRRVHPGLIEDTLKGSVMMSLMMGTAANPLTGAGYRDTSDMAQSMIIGGFFGLGNRAIGSLMEDKPAALRGVAGSLLNGGISTMHGAPTGRQVFDYLLGFFFGAGEKPWHYRQAMQAHQEARKYLQDTGRDPSNLSQIARTGVIHDPKISEIITRNGGREQGKPDGKPVEPIISSFIKLIPHSLVNGENGLAMTLTTAVNKEFRLDPFKTVKNLSYSKIRDRDGRVLVASTQDPYGFMKLDKQYRDEAGRSLFFSPDEIKKIDALPEGKRAQAYNLKSIGWSPDPGSHADSWLKNRFDSDSGVVLINQHSANSEFASKATNGQSAYEKPVVEDWNGRRVAHVSGSKHFITGAGSEPTLPDYMTYLTYHEVMHQQFLPEIAADAASYIHIKFNNGYEANGRNDIKSMFDVDLPISNPDTGRPVNMWDSIIEASMPNPKTGKIRALVNPQHFGHEVGIDPNWMGPLEEIFAKRVLESNYSPKGDASNMLYSYLPDASGEYRFIQAHHRMDYDQGRATIYQEKDNRAMSTVRDIGRLDWSVSVNDPMSSKYIKIPEQVLSDNDIAQVISSMNKELSNEQLGSAAKAFGSRISALKTRDGFVEKIGKVLDSKLAGRGRAFNEFKKGFEFASKTSRYPRIDINDIKSSRMSLRQALNYSRKIEQSARAQGKESNSARRPGNHKKQTESTGEQGKGMARRKPKDLSTTQKKAESQRLELIYEQERLFHLLDQILGDHAVFEKFAKPSAKENYKILTGEKDNVALSQTKKQAVNRSARFLGITPDPDYLYSPNQAVKIAKRIPAEIAREKYDSRRDIIKNSAWWDKRNFSEKFSSTAFSEPWNLSGSRTTPEQVSQANDFIRGLRDITDSFREAGSINEALRGIADKVGGDVYEILSQRPNEDLESIQALTRQQARKWVNKKIDSPVEGMPAKDIIDILTTDGGYVDEVARQTTQRSSQVSDELPSLSIEISSKDGNGKRNLDPTGNTSNTLARSFELLDKQSLPKNKLNESRDHIKTYYKNLVRQSNYIQLPQQISNLLMSDRAWIKERYGKDSGAYKALKDITGEILPGPEDTWSPDYDNLLVSELKRGFNRYIEKNTEVPSLRDFLQNYLDILAMDKPLDLPPGTATRLLSEIYANGTQRINNSKPEGIRKSVRLSANGKVLKVEPLPFTNKSGTRRDNWQFAPAFSEPGNTIVVSDIRKPESSGRPLSRAEELTGSANQPEISRYGFTDMSRDRQRKFIEQAEKKLSKGIGGKYKFIGSKSDSDNLVFYNPTWSDAEFQDKTAGYLKRLDPKNKDDIISGNHDLSDVYDKIISNNLSPEDRVITEFLQKNLPANPEATLRFLSDKSNLIKRLQVIGTAGSRQLPENWSARTTHWRSDDPQAWKAKNKDIIQKVTEADNARESYVNTDQGMQLRSQQFSSDPYSKLITAFIKDPKGNFAENYKYSGNIVSNYPDEPYDGIVFLSDDVFDNYMSGGYSTVNENPQGVEFLKAFYKDGKYLFKAGFARADGPFKELMEREGIDQLVFNTSAKTGVMDKNAADLIEDSNGRFHLRNARGDNSHLSWTDPMNYYHKSTGHSIIAKLYKQLVSMTNMGDGQLSRDILNRVRSFRHFVAGASNPDKMETIIAGAVANMKDLPWNAEGGLDSFLAEWTNTAEIYGWDSIFGLFSQQLGGGSMKQFVNRMTSEVLAPMQSGRTQYLIPKSPTRAKNIRDKTIKDIEQMVSDRGGAMTEEAKNELLNKLTWNKDKVVLGKNMADLPAGYKNLAQSNRQKFEDWTIQASSAIAKGEPIPSLPTGYMVRSPIASIPTITPLEIIGYDNGSVNSYVHPENVKIIKGDHDGDKVALMTDPDESLLKFIQDDKWAFPADVLDYHVTGQEGPSGIIDSVSGILEGKDLVGIVANANLYRHMLIQQKGIVKDRILNKKLKAKLPSGGKLKSLHDIKIHATDPKPGWVRSQMLDKMLDRWAGADVNIKNQVSEYNKSKGFEPGDPGFLRVNNNHLEAYANDRPGAMIDLSLNTAVDAVKSGGFANKDELNKYLWPYILRVEGKAKIDGKLKDISGLPDKDKGFIAQQVYHGSESGRIYKLQNQLKDSRLPTGESMDYETWKNKLSELKSRVDDYLKTNSGSIDDLSFITRGLYNLELPSERLFSGFNEGKGNITPGLLAGRMADNYGKTAKDYYKSKFRDKWGEPGKKDLKSNNSFGRWLSGRINIKKNSLGKFISKYYLKGVKGQNTPASLVRKLFTGKSPKEIFNSEDKYALYGQTINGFNGLIDAVKNYKGDPRSAMKLIGEFQDRASRQVTARDKLKESGSAEDLETFARILDGNTSWLNSLSDNPAGDILKNLAYAGVPIRTDRGRVRFTRDLWRNPMAKMFAREGSRRSVPVESGLDFLAIRQGTNKFSAEKLDELKKLNDYKSTLESISANRPDVRKALEERQLDKDNQPDPTAWTGDDSFTQIDGIQTDAYNSVQAMLSRSKLDLGDATYGSPDQEPYKDYLLFGNDNSYTPMTLSGSGQKELGYLFSRLQSLFEGFPEIKDDWANWVDYKLGGNITNIPQLRGLIDYLYKIKNKPLIEHPAYKDIMRTAFQSYYGVEEQAQQLLKVGYKWTPLSKRPTGNKPRDLFNTPVFAKGIAQEPLSVMGKMKTIATQNKSGKVADMNEWAGKLLKGDYINHNYYADINNSKSPKQVAELNDIIVHMINGGWRYSTKGKPLSKLDLGDVYSGDIFSQFAYKENLDNVQELIDKYKAEGQLEWSYIQDMVSGLTKYLDDFHDGYISTRLRGASSREVEAKKKYYKQKFDQTGDETWMKKMKYLEPINPGRLEAYFPHRWETLSELQQGIEKTIEYIDNSGLSEQQKNKSKQKVIYLSEKLKEDFAGRDYENPFSTKSTPKKHVKGRNLNLQGFRTDDPMGVMRSYISGIVRQKNNLEATARMLKEYQNFEFGNSKKLARKELGGGQNKDLWLQTIKSFVKDNLDIHGARNRSGHIRLYIDKFLNKLTGGRYKMNTDPDYYYFDHGDEAMNARLTKLKRRLTGNPKAKVSKRLMPDLTLKEGKWRLLSMLSVPRAGINNMTGAYTTAFVQSGVNLMRDGRMFKKKHPELFDKLYEQAGVAQSMMDYEFEMKMSTRPSRDKGIHALKAWSDNIGLYSKLIPLKYKKARSKTEEQEIKKQISRLKAQINKNNRIYGVDESITSAGGYVMGKTEQWSREMAFATGYQKGLRMGLDQDSAAAFAKRFTMNTQFGYSNAYRAEKDRSSFGRIMSRFKQYKYEVFRQQKRLWNEAKLAGWDPNTMAAENAFRMIILMMIMSAGASLLPYSLFDYALPPHLGDLEDLADMTFSEDPGRFFFHTFGLSTATSPTSSYALLPLQTFVTARMADPYFENWVTNEVMYQLPFGRGLKTLKDIHENGIKYVPQELGWPQWQLTYLNYKS